MTDRALELLFDTVTGAATPAIGLVMRTQRELNAQTDAAFRRVEAVGGAMLESAPSADLSDGALASVLERIRTSSPAQAAKPSTVPASLRTVIGDCYDQLAWQSAGPGVEEYPIALGDAGHTVSLLRIAPGRSPLTHRHDGEELTLVLDGAYSDSVGTFRRGDLQIGDESLSHKPVAGASGCLCLIVLAAPVRFSGPLGWVLTLWRRLSARKSGN